MLVLSRKKSESVVVGGADSFGHLLKVTVLGVQGGHVKLGFEVDADAPVYRLEVWERIQAKAELHSRGAGSQAPQVGSD